jgi:hypothetical protein
MTKQYSVTYSNGCTESTNSPHEACNFQNYDENQVFMLSGKTVTPEKFYEAAREAREKWAERKNKKYKLVSVQVGATHFGRVNKWILR